MPEQSQENLRSRALGIAGEFADEDGVVAAAKALRGRGYTQLDACVPRPVDELEELLAPERSSLPRTVFFSALFGAVAALFVQWFCNAWDYPLNVGGRPPFSLPAFIPITFEMMVLFGSLAAFFVGLRRMHLPHLTHPLFAVPDFEQASSDKFWLAIGRDGAFDADEVERLLGEHACIAMHWILPGELLERNEVVEAPAPEPEGALS